MAEIFPNEGLDLIYAAVPKGATGPANTWLGLFTSWSASTVAGSAATVASWAEVSVAGAYVRATIASSSWGTVGTTQSGRGSAAAQVTFATATAVWGTVNGFIVASGATGGAGTVWYGANFDDTTAVAVNTNDVIKVTPTWVYTGWVERDSLEQEVVSLRVNVEQLWQLVRDHEQRFDTLQTRWWKRLWFRCDGWPGQNDLNAARRAWRPWH